MRIGPSLVLAALVQRAVDLHHIDEALPVLGAQLLIETASCDCFGEKLAELAAGIVDCFALLDWLAAVDFIVLQEGGTRCVDFDFKRYLELTTKPKHGAMHRGQTRRTHVLIEAFAPGDGLLRAVDELDNISVACAPCTAARTMTCLEEGHLIAKLLCFVSGHQAAYATT